MTATPWFRVWAAETLLSDSLDELSDHEERIWWRLLCVASLSDDRWSFPVVSGSLAKKCRTTQPKLVAAIHHFIELGMVSTTYSGFLVTNGERYNPRSDSKESVKERVTRHRAEKRNAVTDVTVAPLHIGNAGNALDLDRDEEKRREEVDKDVDDGGAAAFRERYGTLAVAFGDPRERRLIDEFVQIANDASLEEIREGIAMVRRAGQKPYPSKVWAAISELRTPVETKRSLEDFMESMYEPA